MPIETGLLTGLAEGIKSGMASYQDARRTQALEKKLAAEDAQALEDRALKQRLFDLEQKKYDSGQVKDYNSQVLEAGKSGFLPDFDETGRINKDLKINPEYRLQKQKEAAAADPLKQAILQERLDKLEAAKAESARLKTPQGRIEKLASTDKARLDNSRMALDSVRSMANSLLDKGENTFSVFGDNPYTLSRGQFEEALGRMQSGGAIGVEEAQRFKDMAPTVRDSPEIQKKKLANLEKEMSARLRTLGFNEDDLSQAGYSISSLSPKTQGLLTPKSKVAPDIQEAARQEIARRQAANKAKAVVR